MDSRSFTELKRQGTGVGEGKETGICGAGDWRGLCRRQKSPCPGTRRARLRES